MTAEAPAPGATSLNTLPATIEPGTVRLLQFDLDDPGWQAAADMLDRAEADRAARFHFARDAARFRAAHVALRRVLGHHLGRTPDTLRFHVGPFGKPALEPDAPLQFNLSHAAGHGLIGLSVDGPIGVDVEQLRPLADRDALVAANFTRAERDEYARLPADLRHDAFFAGWTRKEAIIKADGRGLSMGLENAEVSLDPRAPLEVLCNEHSRCPPWTLWSARWPAGAWLAAAVHRSPVRFFAHHLLKP